MLPTTVFETTILFRNRKKGVKGEIDNKVGGNNHWSLCKFVEFRKNTFFRKKFLTPEARLTFIWLREMFMNSLILHYFFLEWYIFIKTDNFGYGIGEIFSQIILN